MVAQPLLPVEGPPNLPPGQEEPLVARDPVKDRSFRPVQGEPIGVVGDLKAAIVADILPKAEAAVES